MLEAPQFLPVVYNADSQAIAITRYANLTHSGTTGRLIGASLVYDSMNRLTSKITPQARRLRRRGPVEVTPLYHQTNNFTCDHDGQLLTTTASAMPAENLAFDPSGNRNSAGYTPYDDNGSMTTDDQGHLLIYDAWNRLVAVENSDGTLIKAYTYDGLGRRITESTLNEDATLNTTDIYFSAGGQILEEYQGSAATERNIFSPIYVNATLLRDNGTSLGTRVTFTSDANFNVAGVFSIPGTTLQHQVYSGYGEITWTDASWNSTGSDGYPLENLFQSMHYDATIGWYVTPNRLYRAPLAYWNRVDPAQADGLNWYVPFAANPISRRDPSGLQYETFRLAFAHAPTCPLYTVAEWDTSDHDPIYAGGQTLGARLHTYIVVTHEDGTRILYRGGPAGANWSGAVVARVLNFDGPGNTVDNNHNGTDNHVILFVTRDKDEERQMDATLQSIVNQINLRAVSYSWLGYNSNSVTGTLLRHAGLTSAFNGFGENNDILAVPAPLGDYPASAQDLA